MFNPNYDYQMQHQFLREVKRKGLTINIPDEHTLQLDLDTEEQWQGLQEKMHALEAMMAYGMRITDVTVSSSGPPHLHVYISMIKPISSVEEQIGAQMFLGSDPKKELLSLCRVAARIEPATLLIEGDWKNE